jgi:endonuclease/exonuclease/phosphatase family metal-dependent hydrolase
MTSNIWGDYFGNPVDVRIDDIYGIYKKYDPDILGLQEITKRWYESGLFERLAEDYAWVGTEIADSNNFVPFCYKKSYKLIAKGYEYLVETPDVTKGITWAVLKAEDEKLFAVCNTHFWWKTGPEHDEIRVKNAHQLVRLMKYLKELYNCPVFAFGDMNTTLSSDVFEVYSQNGIKHMHDLADQKDNMSSMKPVFPVKIRIKTRIFFRHKVFCRMITFITQTSTYNLFHFSIMYINTRPKFHISFSFQKCSDVLAVRRVF